MKAVKGVYENWEVGLPEAVSEKGPADLVVVFGVEAEGPKGKKTEKGTKRIPRRQEKTE